MQDVVLAAFLEVHHELHGEPRAAGPARIGRVAAIAAEIAGIGFGHQNFLAAARAAGIAIIHCERERGKDQSGHVPRHARN